MRLNTLFKLKEVMCKQWKSRLLEVVEYPQWILMYYGDYIKKKKKEVRVCVDFKELNKTSSN
jgi:hypothetical protein